MVNVIFLTNIGFFYAGPHKTAKYVCFNVRKKIYNINIRAILLFPKYLKN